MNGAQLHLMLNHLPVMGALFSLIPRNRSA
jgi:hypothetical protein